MKTRKLARELQEDIIEKQTLDNNQDKITKNEKTKKFITLHFMEFRINNPVPYHKVRVPFQLI